MKGRAEAPQCLEGQSLSLFYPPVGPYSSGWSGRVSRDVTAEPTGAGLHGTHTPCRLGPHPQSTLLLPSHAPPEPGGWHLHFTKLLSVQFSCTHKQGGEQ